MNLFAPDLVNWGRRPDREGELNWTFVQLNSFLWTKLFSSCQPCHLKILTQTKMAISIQQKTHIWARNHAVAATWKVEDWCWRKVSRQKLFEPPSGEIGGSKGNLTADFVEWIGNQRWNNGFQNLAPPFSENATWLKKWRQVNLSKICASLVIERPKMIKTVASKILEASLNQMSTNYHISILLVINF